MRTTVLRDHIFRAAHLNGLLGAHTGNYVIVTPSIVQQAAGANMSVDVGAFTYVLGGVFGAKTSTTNVVVQASDANPRIDLLYLSTGGTLTVMKGTAAAVVPTGEATWQKWEEPYPPDFSATDGILLAEIEVPGSATSILNAYIRNITVQGIVLGSTWAWETMSGTGTAHTLGHTPVANSVSAYRNGQLVMEGSGSGYTRSGADVTLTTARGSDVILYHYQY